MRLRLPTWCWPSEEEDPARTHCWCHHERRSVLSDDSLVGLLLSALALLGAGYLLARILGG